MAAGTEGADMKRLLSIDAAGAAGAPAMDKLAADGEAHDLTCAICLDTIALEELSIIKGCEHAYCSKCILAWAVQKDPPWCPQCKAPFTRLVTYRALDGTLSDFPAEESVCLLKRACWFQAYLREAEEVAAAVPSTPYLLDAADAAAIAEVQAGLNDYGRYYEEYDDDEEVEAYYFSAAAGRARITLGNRRFGNNGYIASGRMQARPAQPARPSKGKAAAKGEASGSGSGASAQPRGRSPPSAAPATPATPVACAEGRAPGRTPMTAAKTLESLNSVTPTPPPRPRGPGDTTVRRNSGGAPARKGPGGSPAGFSGGGGEGRSLPEGAEGAGSGSSAGKQQAGRRARRNAQRAAMDARGGLASP